MSDNRDSQKNPENARRDSSAQPPPRQHGGGRMLGAWISMLLLLGLIGFLWLGGSDNVHEIAYSPEFTDLLQCGWVKEVNVAHGEGISIVSGKAVIPSIESNGENTDAEADPLVERLRSRFSEPGELLFRVNVGDPDSLDRILVASGVTVRHGREDTKWSAILMSLLPTLMLIGVIYYIFVRQMKGISGSMGFGKSRARRLEQGQTAVLFKDVAGCAEAKEDMKEIVAYLKDPKKFSRLGAKMPHGILLEGPPGTGKTLLAKAIAGEAGVPFFSISGSDFVEMFVGVGASRVRDMFAEAKKNKPCLLFIDEIDAVGRSRFTGIGGGHDEREQTLNALLVEMDGFESNDGVVVIAATNRPDVLDKALLRPGRFDREVVVALPTMEDRLAILKVHAQKVKLAEGTDLSRVARGTPGCSGADLANIVNEAAILASKAEKPGIDIDDFEEARDRVLWGRQNIARNKSMDEKEKRLTAFHESGHAVLTVLAGEDADPVHKVTIIPRGMSLGATMFLPKKDKVSLTRKHLLADLVISMGGRVAEEMFMDDVTTGARQDLKQATELARAMVCDWGLSEELGPRTFGNNQEVMFLGREVSREQDYSEQTAQRIDAEVTKLLREAHEKARQQLEEHRAAVELMATTLLDRETIDGDVAEAIVKTGRVPDPPAPPAPPPPPGAAENSALPKTAPAPEPKPSAPAPSPATDSPVPPPPPEMR